VAVADGGSGGATPDPDVWKPVERKLVQALQDATSDDPSLVVRADRRFRDPETGEAIKSGGKIQRPDVVVVNTDEQTLVAIGEAKSGSQQNLDSVWEQLQQRVDSADGKAHDAILIALQENEKGQATATIKNGEADPDLADKIQAALEDQGIDVVRVPPPEKDASQQSMTLHPPKSGLIADPLPEREPWKEGFTYEPQGPKTLINTPAPSGPRCCTTIIPEWPTFKEIFPVDPFGGVRTVASRLWPW
jgi:hypothetical protein